MGKQRISSGYPYAVYVNETSASQRIAPGVYVDETSPSAVTVAITGVAGTGSVGSVSNASLFTIPLTGVSGTGAAGSVSPSVTIPITGVSGTGQVGDVGVQSAITLAITGVEGTGQVGTVTVAVVETGTVGGHFIPLTEKQLRELRKRERAAHKSQEDLDTSRKLDAEAIEADIRKTMFPGPELLPLNDAEPSVELADDDDEDLEILLLHS